MNFWELKKKVLKFKDNIIDKWAKKLIDSNFVIKEMEDLKKFITKSKTKQITSNETGEKKEFIKKIIIIFAEKDSDFFEKSLFQLPILSTKAYSQNIPLKMCNIDIAELKNFKIKKQPCLVVFETEKIVNIVEWEENISKIVKTLNLDINKAIDEI